MGYPVVHFEINGSDGAALAQFYGELFGWKTEEYQGSGYHVVETQAGEGINGGIGTAGEGTSPGVTFYVATPDLQATLDRAQALGGAAAAPIVEMEMVTFAALTDPEGNRIGIVGPGEGPGVSNGDGRPVGWWEVLGAEPGKLRDFYTELFEWTVSSSITEAFEYHLIDTGAGGQGINGGIGSSPDGEPHVNVYAGVDDVQKYCERAESLGAKVVMQPTKVAENTTVALFLDPQGNTFGLFEGM
jgi:hypothetical protein